MTEKARIRVLEVLEAAGGGALTHVFQIAERLDKDEFDVTVVLSPTRMQDPARDIERLRRVGVPVELVPMRRRPAPVADVTALRRLTELIRLGGYDVVHAHSSKAGFLGRWAARRAGVSRVFYTPHAFAFQCGGLAGWLYERFERLAARFGGTVLAVSEGEKELAVGRGIVPADRVRVVPNAIEPPAEPTRAERSAARAALGVSGAIPVVGTVGRLAPQKGHASLVRAAAQVVRSHPAARFVIIGSGRLEGRLRRLAREAGVGENLLFAGERDDAAGLGAAFDVYVQPSLWEGLPYALLEAMGRGLAVVATDIPGHREVVRREATGLLVPAQDVTALADAIEALLGDSARRRALGEAGRELVLSRHRLADFIGAISELYRGG